MQSEAAISRELMGKIVDEVFDGAIEDPSVIEEIYAVIKREEANLSKIEERKPLYLNITQDWFEKRSALEADHEIGAGPRKFRSCVNPTQDELAELFKIAHRIPDGWQLVPIAALSAAEPQPAPSVAVKALEDAFKHFKVVYDPPKGVSINEATRRKAIEVASSALTAQVQDVAGTVEAFDKDHPELYWHIAKGKITAGEPLYGAIITDLRGNELGDGESNVSAIDAFNIAVDEAALPAAPATQEASSDAI